MPTKVIKPPEPPVWTRRYWEEFGSDIADHTIHSILQVGAIVLAYVALRFVLFRLIDATLAGLISREQRVHGHGYRSGRLRTLQGLCKSILGYILFFLFAGEFIEAIGFHIGPFLTAAGVVGLAVGFGSQKLVKDVISGFFIIVDNLFIVGDTITIGAVTGQVREMGMRVTQIVDGGGKVYLFANGDIGTITNLSRNPISDSIDVSVAADADLNRAIETINATGETLMAADDHHLKKAPIVQGITAFNAASVTLRITVAADPGALSAEQMRVRGAVRDALREAGIALPPA